MPWLLSLALLAADAGSVPCRGDVPEAQRPAAAEACLHQLQSTTGEPQLTAAELLGHLGRPALPALQRCTLEQQAPTTLGRCAWALGITRLPEAEPILLQLAARPDLAGDALSATAQALGALHSTKALPRLESWLGRTPSAAAALFAVDPARWQALPPEQQRAYATDLAEQGARTPHLREDPAFRAQLPALLRLVAAGVRDGQIAPVPGLLALRTAGDATYAPEVAAFLARAQGFDARNALDLLESWRAPAGVERAVALLADPEVRDQAARYLGAVAQQSPAAGEALWAAWQARPAPAERCRVVFPLLRAGRTPPPVELAALLRSPCRHDMTLAWERLDTASVPALVAYLKQAPAEDAAREAVQEALDWQCAARPKRPGCAPARALVRGHPRPEHPD